MDSEINDMIAHCYGMNRRPGSRQAGVRIAAASPDIVAFMPKLAM
jgi:hypothetical protein